MNIGIRYVTRIFITEQQQYNSSRNININI